MAFICLFGLQNAEQIMNHKLRSICSTQLGGDTQGNLHVQSQKSAQTFKHIILPIWLCSDYCRSKLYHFTINDQTGKVLGKQPISWWKIAGLILIFALFIFGVWYLRKIGVF
jgi:hypothetical protein